MTEDWGMFFSDFGVDATLNGAKGRIMIDEPDGIVQGGMLVVSERTLVWRYGQWPEAAEKDVVETDCRRFRLTESPRAEADGQIMRAPVKELR